MLPDLRFAIGAVLASALLIVAAFGLAATVRVAHHRAATPDDPWRTLAFTDPHDMGLLADRSRPQTAAKTELPEVPPADLAVATADPDTTGAINRSEREPPAEGVDTGERLAAPDPPPAAVTPRAPAEPAADRPESNAVEVVAAIPHIAAEPVQAAPAPPRVESRSIDDEPLEPSERVGVLPGFPTAGPGFVPLPPQHPIALPVPDPRGKVAAKQAAKKKTPRRRYRFALPPPLADTGYPVTGFPEIKFPTTSNDRKWTVVGE
jgi:hypothetical protein